MDAINNSSQQTATSQKTKKLLNALKKGLLYLGAIIGGLLLLVCLYKVLEFLFVAAILFIAWICPKRWW